MTDCLFIYISFLLNAHEQKKSFTITLYITFDENIYIMAKAPSPKTFEEAMEKLDNIVSSMQNNELPLEDALNAYKEGNLLIQFCQKKLADVEEQLKMFDGNALVDLPEDSLNTDQK